jgi:hypothetical protein
VEGRPLAKENAEQHNLYRTPSRKSGPRGRERVREAARKDGKLRFTAVLHHVSIEQLRDSYNRLKKQAAPGVDGLWFYRDEFIAGHIERSHPGESLS